MVPMNRSLKTSGQTSADRSVVSSRVKPAASKSALGRAFTSGRRLRATQPIRPWPLLMTNCWMASASSPDAKRQRSVSVSSLYRNSAQQENGTMLLNFDEMSAIVSDTPRLLPMACAISYSA